MSGPGALVATALVGVARRSPPGTERVGDHLVEGRTARAVLDAASLHAVAGRAGRRAGRAVVAGQVPEMPDLAPAPEGAARLLDLLLGGSSGRRAQTASLVGHWVRCAAASGHRVPHPLLVPLLEQQRPGPKGAVDPDLVTVLGTRGRWLAGLNPGWRWVVAEPPGTERAAAAEPLSARESRKLVKRFRNETNPATFARENAVDLGERLHPSVIGGLQRWHDGLEDDQRYLALPLRDIIKHISTRAAITDAFETENQEER